MRHARRATGVVLATVLGASLAACGGSDGPATSGPTSAAPSSSSPTPSATTSPSASPTSTTPPLSRFEDDPAVQGARAWAKAIATDVNNKDTSYTQATPLSTKRARGKFDIYEGDDMKAGLTFLGPPPFTPVRVRSSATTTTVVTCYWLKGWAVDPATQKAPQKRQVVGADFVMVKSKKGVWQLNQLVSHDIDCSGVNVKGVPF